VEVEGESPNFDAVGIAVGFEESAMFIFADDADRLEKLNTALAQGGQAIGLIGVSKIGKHSLFLLAFSANTKASSVQVSF
jgi:hypothetical protein